jgi:hypothetical protein
MALNLIDGDETFEVCDKDLPGVSDGDPEVFYSVRRLDPQTHKRIVKAHTKWDFVRGVGKVEKVDGAAAADDIFDHILVGWRGVLLHGQPAACSRDWKLKGLDFTRRAALVDLAGMNQIARAPEVRAESFQESPAGL